MAGGRGMGTGGGWLRNRSMITENPSKKRCVEAVKTQNLLGAVRHYILPTSD